MIVKMTQITMTTMMRMMMMMIVVVVVVAGFWGLQEPMLFVKLKMNKQDGYQGMGMQHTSTGLADCGGDDDAGLGFRVLGFRV